MDQYILEMQSSYRCFESFLNLTDLVGSTTDSVATEGFNIKNAVNNVKTAIINFFKRLWTAITNFWAKIFNKEGKLLNKRGAEIIIREANYYNATMKSAVNDVIKSTNFKDWIRLNSSDGSYKLGDSDIDPKDGYSKFDEIDARLEMLVNKVETAVLNSPKISDYKKYNKNDLDQFEATIKLAQDTANDVIEKVSKFKLSPLEEPTPLAESMYNDMLHKTSVIIKDIMNTCSKMSTVMMQAMEAATYKSEKENSKIEFEEVEVEIDPDLL